MRNGGTPPRIYCTMQNEKGTPVRFGTDGIRGVYGEELTDGLAMLVGNSLGIFSGKGTVVVGRDTRTSGENLARALAEGALAAGCNVVDLGVVTTPCVAFVTRETGANFGVMVSASHNPPRYNGIKLFAGDGRKLSREKEAAVERHIAEAKLSYAEFRGEKLPSCGMKEHYIDAVCARGNLSGVHVVLDTANGAAGELAPEIFSRMGARVDALFTSDDGELINENCGALHPEILANEVVKRGADMGLCFDGDADRVIAADEKGDIVNGDKIIYILARALAADDRLPLSAVVGTLHTNMGVEAGLNGLGIELVRTDIGDHNVIRCMCDAGIMLGGEQSGHIILGDFLPTGDGVGARACHATQRIASFRPRRLQGVSPEERGHPHAQKGKNRSRPRAPRIRGRGGRYARRKRARHDTRERHGAENPRHGGEQGPLPRRLRRPQHRAFHPHKLRAHLKTDCTATNKKQPLIGCFRHFNSSFGV